MLDLVQVMVIITIIVYLLLFIINIIEKTTDKKKIKENLYYQKNLMTKYEKYFYSCFAELEEELGIRIQPQVSLNSIVEKRYNYRQRLELFRDIDFGIFEKDYSKLLLLVEINDKTHNLKNRIKRDQKVKEIVNCAHIRLITFYSDWPNEKSYLKKRITEEVIRIREAENKNIIQNNNIKNTLPF